MSFRFAVMNEVSGAVSHDPCGNAVAARAALDTVVETVSDRSPSGIDVSVSVEPTDGSSRVPPTDRIAAAVSSLAECERGAASIEYVLMLSLLATAILGSLNVVGEQISNLFAKACPVELCSDAGPAPEPILSAPVNYYQKTK